MAFLLSIYQLLWVAKLQCEVQSLCIFSRRELLELNSGGTAWCNTQPDAEKYGSTHRCPLCPATLCQPPRFPLHIPRSSALRLSSSVCKCLTKGFPPLCVTDVGLRPFSPDTWLNQLFPEQRNLKISSTFYSMTAPKLLLKSQIVDIVNCISISLFESGPRHPKQ